MISDTSNTGGPIATLVADPPWPYRDRLPGKGRGAEKHYKTLSISEIQRFPLPVLALNARLYLWTTGQFLESALDVMRVWDFAVTGQQMVWHKLGRLGMGRHVRVNHEFVLIGTRGRPVTIRKNVRSVFASKPGKHSEKPEEFYETVEVLSPGPYCDLFARRQRPGWLCLGDELVETLGAAEIGTVGLELMPGMIATAIPEDGRP